MPLEAKWINPAFKYFLEPPFAYNEQAYKSEEMENKHKPNILSQEQQQKWYKWKENINQLCI